MTSETLQDLQGLKAAGKVVGHTIAEMKKSVVPGMTTAELDEVGARILNHFGAKSAPKVTYNFPGTTCISVNEEVAHGIPGQRVIQAGDLINIDVSAELNGYYGDAGVSFQLPPYNEKLVHLCRSTEETMMSVINHLRAGMKVNEIGRVMESEAHKRGYKVVRNLCSHGIGKSLHEKPYEILPFYNPRVTTVLKEGQVITIEPFLSTGADFVEQQSDGWTLSVADNSRVAQYEHTIVVTKGKPIILTSA
ncbi:type I methionyl aminopeptidase [Paenibacillus sp. FSL R7-0297]|jgi:methionyl aminopeptidase|uniref:Methionine aminopeptidase n=1 Tax=Paenibacillus phytohabitans TaxID=2654978 RepID=A0ABX1YBW7_9BACL|nr:MULTISPECIES: type I methionyl aminopeptidase [Paenibacillus]AIQ41047.1 methionine aminopeptidase [Paenibacillus sp. FSL R5-0912]KHL95751.1 methionine aminopeptidase [Paenibacillus sp. IHB B 3415]NOU78447.1 type I methionyl aminopeptidase [Paenibacillus phytohabitans]